MNTIDFLKYKTISHFSPRMGDEDKEYEDAMHDVKIMYSTKLGMDKKIKDYLKSAGLNEDKIFHSKRIFQGGMAGDEPKVLFDGKSDKPKIAPPSPHYVNSKEIETIEIKDLSNKELEFLNDTLGNMGIRVGHFPDSEFIEKLEKIEKMFGKDSLQI